MKKLLVYCLVLCMMQPFSCRSIRQIYVDQNIPDSFDPLDDYYYQLHYGTKKQPSIKPETPTKVETFNSTAENIKTTTKVPHIITEPADDGTTIDDFDEDYYYNDYGMDDFFTSLDHYNDVDDSTTNSKTPTSTTPGQIIKTTKRPKRRTKTPDGTGSSTIFSTETSASKKSSTTESPATTEDPEINTETLEGSTSDDEDYNEEELFPPINEYNDDDALSTPTIYSTESSTLKQESTIIMEVSTLVSCETSTISRKSSTTESPATTKDPKINTETLEESTSDEDYDEEEWFPPINEYDDDALSTPTIYSTESSTLKQGNNELSTIEGSSDNDDDEEIDSTTATEASTSRKEINTETPEGSTSDDDDVENSGSGSGSGDGSGDDDEDVIEIVTSKPTTEKNIVQYEYDENDLDFVFNEDMVGNDDESNIIQVLTPRPNTQDYLNNIHFEINKIVTNKSMDLDGSELNKKNFNEKKGSGLSYKEVDKVSNPNFDGSGSGFDDGENDYKKEDKIIVANKKTGGYELEKNSSTLASNNEKQDEYKIRKNDSFYYKEQKNEVKTQIAKEYGFSNNNTKMFHYYNNQKELDKNSISDVFINVDDYV